MEAALAREEARATARREAVDAMRRLRRAAGGGRAPRRARGARPPAGDVEEGGDGARAARPASTRGWCARAASTCASRGGAWCRVGGAARELGRDRAAEVTLRDPRCLAPARDPARGSERDHRRGRRLARRASVSAARASTRPSRCAARASSASATAPRWRSRPLSDRAVGVAAAWTARCARWSASTLVSLAPLVPGRRRRCRSGFAGGGARLASGAPDVAVRVDGQFIGPAAICCTATSSRCGAPASLRLEVE